MKKINLAVLLSGSGRTLQNFIDLIGQEKLPATIQVVISSKKDAYGLERAKKHNIPNYVVEHKQYSSTCPVRKNTNGDKDISCSLEHNAELSNGVKMQQKLATAEEFSQAINNILNKYPIDLIAMAGFLNLYIIPPEYKGKVMNIHPALLPDFGGKGFYTDKVHQAVLDAGVKFSGCTVHFADNTYDTGPIILQKKVPVLENDTAHTLADRVFQAELEAYPEAIRLFAEGKLQYLGTTDKHG
jgi:formyltetrahydrofolate-dependent phosphoribosylglycinamide formyltransferase